MDKYQNRALVDFSKAHPALKDYWTIVVKESYIMQNQNCIVLQSRLRVDKPWYFDPSDSEGHMSAIDLNLAFNQMMSIAISQSIQLGWIPALHEFGQDYFTYKCIPDLLITKIESEFKTPLSANNFCGTLRISKIKESTKHLWFTLDLGLKPGEEDFPEPGELSHASSKMTLVLYDYKNYLLP